MKNFQKGSTVPLIIVILVVIVGIYFYSNKQQTDNTPSDAASATVDETQSTGTQNTATITVVSPNGGEIIPITDLVMAGDLYFTWTTSQGEDYKPSSSLTAELIDVQGMVVRNDPVQFTQDGGNGSFTTSFATERNVKKGAQYKVRVCDVVNGTNVCDTSDAYFSIN